MPVITISFCWSADRPCWGSELRALCGAQAVKARPVRIAIQQGGPLLTGTEGIYSIGSRFGYPRPVGRM